MTYRIGTNNEDYMAFHIEPKELRARMGDDIKIHMGAEPDRYLPNWVKPDAAFYISDDYPSAIKIPDITIWGEFLALNDKAYQALATKLSDYGEFLPVNCEGNDYYIFNILKIIDDMGGVDESQSIKKEESGIFLGLEKLVFNESVAADLLIFRTAFDDHQRIFCSDHFLQLAEKSGLNGVTYKSDLEGLF